MDRAHSKNLKCEATLLNIKLQRGNQTPAAQKMDSSKAIIKNSDMSENMQQKAVDYAKEGMDQYGVEKEVASHVKKAFDRDFGPTWHCIVGRNFGSYVTHETNCFIYFYLKSIAVLLYKSG